MVYVISDLHGYPLEEFEKLLSKAGFSDRDYCFVLGDVIDRGDGGVELLEWLLYQPNVQLIMGNHEAMMLSCKFLFEEITEESVSRLDAEKLELYSTWMENGGKPTLSALAKLDADLRNDIFEYLSEAPLYETVEIAKKNFVLTHSGIAGFTLKKKLNEYESDYLLWNRPDINDRYYSDSMVVFGHTPTHYIMPERKGKILVTETWIDIDTGVSCGLKPTLLRLDDMTTYQ